MIVRLDLALAPLTLLAILLLGQAAQHAVRWPVDVAKFGVGLATSVLRVGRTVNERSGADLAAPLATPRLPYDGPITADRSIAFRSLPFDRVRQLAKTTDTRINDVVLAVLAGTMRRWLLAHDALPDKPIVAAVPVSTRTPEQLFSPGNYVSALFAHLPTDIDDPVERLAVTAAVAALGPDRDLTIWSPQAHRRSSSLSLVADGDRGRSHRLRRAGARHLRPRSLS